MHLKKSYRYRYLLLFSLVALLAFLAYLLIDALAAAPLEGNETYPPPGGSEALPQSPESFCATSFPVHADLPPEKRAIEEIMHRRCVEARKSPFPTAEIRPRANIPRRNIGAGTIIAAGQQPFPSLTIYNLWYAEIDGKIVRVFAGAKTGDGARTFEKPWQGLLMIMVSAPYYSKLYPEEGGSYPTPEKVGAIRIIDAKDMQLILLAENGQLFVFDIVSRQYKPTSIPTPYERAAGNGTLVESGESPISDTKYIFTNQWYEEKEGKRISVFAGRELDNDRQGVLIVVTTAIDTQTVLSQETYRTPVAVGPLQIFDVEGERITAPAGSIIFIFDVGLLKFTTLPEIPPTLPAQSTPGTDTPTALPSPIFTPQTGPSATLLLPYP